MRHPGRRLRAVPLRLRLVSGFAAAMIIVLTAAGGFVYWRVEVALDHTVDSELAIQAARLRQALERGSAPPSAALDELATGAEIEQVLDGPGHVIAATHDAPSGSLLDREQLAAAKRGPVRFDIGRLLLNHRRRLRVLAFPLASQAPGQAQVAVTAARLSQRDEALRELLAQLAIANLAALAVASGVGYRLARAALAPVERYRSRAEAITDGATGVRLDVPEGVDDEVSRLGHTLNRMLAAQEAAATSQRQFLADASHELRTPLTVVTSEVQLALRRPRTVTELEVTLQHVADDTARLVRLADQLLDLERAQGAVVVEPGGADVAAAVGRAALRARSRLSDVGRDLLTQSSTCRVANMSDSLLDQVLYNLVNNAITHGAGRVCLRVEEPPDAGAASFVRIEVGDQGEGMAADFVPEAIGRFRRADTARSTAGSGLGLALVHTIVSGAGGELRMCTQDRHHTYPPIQFPGVACAVHGQGSTVTVVLRVLHEAS